MLEIVDVEELYALQKGLMEIRFNASDVDWAVQGSPLLARLHTRVVESIIAHHESVGEVKKADGWREWRRYDTRALEHPAIRAYLEKMWPEMRSNATKRQAAINQMQPFNFAEEDVLELIAILDSEGQEQTGTATPAQ